MINIEEISDEYLYKELQKRIKNETSLLQLLFFATLDLMVKTDSEEFKMSSELRTINKIGKLKINLKEIKD